MPQLGRTSMLPDRVGAGPSVSQTCFEREFCVIFCYLFVWKDIWFDLILWGLTKGMTDVWCFVIAKVVLSGKGAVASLRGKWEMGRWGDGRRFEYEFDVLSKNNKEMRLLVVCYIPFEALPTWLPHLISFNAMLKVSRTKFLSLDSLCRSTASPLNKLMLALRHAIAVDMLINMLSVS
jgi:hypothetical protein